MCLPVLKDLSCKCSLCTIVSCKLFENHLTLVKPVVFILSSLQTVLCTLKTSKSASIVCPSLGPEPLKSLLLCLCFFCILEKSGKKQATDLAVNKLLGSAIAEISAYVLGQHMWASAGQGPSSTSPKQWKSNRCFKIYNSVSERWPLTILRNKKS